MSSTISPASAIRHTVQTKRLVLPKSHAAPVPSEAALVHAISTRCEQFSLGSAAMVDAIRRERAVTILLNVSAAESSTGGVAGWRCTRGARGLDLVPLGFTSELREISAERGDVLIACDPSGESEVIFQLVSSAARQGATTISISGANPNLLAARATFPIRVPITAPARPQTTITVLRHLVQSAGSALEGSPPGMPAWRRVGLL